jgi:O-methyltransferase involved in polyketide biosynthesis
VAVQQVEERFLRKRGDASDSIKRQVINMGCGYDTFVFSLTSNKEKYCPFKYIELDLQEVVQKKVNQKLPRQSTSENRKFCKPLFTPQT